MRPALLVALVAPPSDPAPASLRRRGPRQSHRRGTGGQRIRPAGARFGKDRQAAARKRPSGQSAAGHRLRYIGDLDSRSRIFRSARGSINGWRSGTRSASSTCWPAPAPTTCSRPRPTRRRRNSFRRTSPPSRPSMAALPIFRSHSGATALDAIAAKLETAPAAERNNPKFKAGLNQIGGSIAQTIAGVLTTFTTDGITDDWRRARLESLNAVAPKVAKAIPAPIRNKLREIALDVSEKMQDPQIKESVKAACRKLREIAAEPSTRCRPAFRSSACAPGRQSSWLRHRP